MLGLPARKLGDFDWLLLSAALGLTLFGLLEISSAEAARSSLAGITRNQIWGVLAGLVVMTLMTVRDYRVIVGAAPYFYGIGIVMLVLVLTPLGKEVNGNRNWLNLGFVQLQPSEFVKIFTLLMLVRFMSDSRERPPSPLTLAKVTGLWALPTLLVYLEGDIGSTLSFTSFFAVILFLCGLQWRIIAAVAAVLILTLGLSIPQVCNSASRDYKVQRIKAVYCRADQVDRRFSYQNEQSEIAVGSGGIFGKGFGGGSQGLLGFVPAIHTDFIFALASEERGYLGSLLILVLYLVVLLRMLQIARQARDRTGLLLVTGFAALLLYHIMVSVGMVVRLLPIMGIPLPFMSFGRSSILATYFGFGLALNVHLRRFVN